jgi:glutathionylspermidine synthase
VTREVALSLPWKCEQSLAPDVHARLQRRAIFDCCKWHTHVNDAPVLCPFPMVMAPDAWRHAAGLAEALASEALAAEKELLRRPELLHVLSLPAPLRRCLRSLSDPTPGAARVMRFDFHWTADGWRISEGNVDAAGGFVEASGVTRLMADHYPPFAPAGDPAGALAAAIERTTGPGGRVALMYLTVYAEDHQVMLYLARRLAERGLVPSSLGPSQLRWVRGRADAASDAYAGPLDLVVRFFFGWWLPRLPPATGWRGYFDGGRTPCCNPGYAILTHGKRFPLVWDRLATPLPTWRALLPETRSPDSGIDAEDRGWVFKPFLGHEGEGVGMSGVTKADDLTRIRRAALSDPGAWVVQRRFETLLLPTPEGPAYPCLGIYVIDGKAAGAYTRLGAGPIIDGKCREVAVLVGRAEGGHDDAA